MRVPKHEEKILSYFGDSIKVAAAIALTLLVPAVAAAQEDRPPNVVLILADDLGYNDISLHGNTRVRTPNIDSIGTGGVWFSRGHTTAPMCSPSRAGLLTGRYQQRFGFEFVAGPTQMFLGLAGGPERVVANGGVLVDIPPERRIPQSEMGIPPSTTNLAELLKASGYATGVVGKWHVGEGPKYSPLNRGFDYAVWASQVLYGREDDPAMTKAKLPWDSIDKFLWRMLRFSINREDGPHQPEVDMTTYQANEAVQFIEQNKDDPFFLYVPFFAPHTPLQAPKRYYDRLEHIADHKTRVYYAMIECMDDAVGRILGKLRAEGLEENTIVIFASDNGAAGYTRIPNTNQPFRGSKLTYYQGGVVVPYLMRWPKGLPAGTAIHAPVSLMDIYPTVAAAVGAQIPAGQSLDGVNLIPFIKGEDKRAPHNALVWRAGATRAVLHGDYRLIIDDTQGISRLYNITRDVGERHDLTQGEAAQALKLKGILEEIESGFTDPRWMRPFYTRITSDIWPSDPPEDAPYMYF